MNANVKSAPDPKGLSKSAIAFLEARGLDTELCERLGLTSGPDRAGTEWLAFPYEREGRRVNRKFRRIDAKEFRQEKGGEQILWRFDCLTDAALAEEPLIITEGEFDAIAAIQAGYWRTVSVPGGAPTEALKDEARTAAKYAAITQASDQLNGAKRIIVATDSDGPGIALMSDITSILGPARCQFLSYPKGCKDLNDVLMAQGVEGVQRVISAARWARVAGVHKLSELPPLPPLQVWRPDVFEPIDKMIPICPGHLSVWTGIPGHGKSSLLNAIVWSIAKRDGRKICHGTFEQVPQREYLSDATGFLTGIPWHKASQGQREEAADWVDRHITFLIADGYPGPGKEEFFDANLAWFFEGARSAIARDGAEIIVLDPWSQIEHEHAANEPETTYVQKSIRRAKTFARAFNVHVAIVAHPTKMRRLEDGSYAMPEGYEISGSAHWFNGVDLGVTSHRAAPLVTELDGKGQTTGEWVPDPHSTRVLIRVWKKKNHRLMGKPGDVFASFDSDTNRYSPAEHWEARTMRRSLRDDPLQRSLVDDD